MYIMPDLGPPNLEDLLTIVNHDPPVACAVDVHVHAQVRMRVFECLLDCLLPPACVRKCLIFGLCMCAQEFMGALLIDIWSLAVASWDTFVARDLLPTLEVVRSARVPRLFLGPNILLWLCITDSGFSHLDKSVCQVLLGGHYERAMRMMAVQMRTDGCLPNLQEVVIVMSKDTTHGCNARTIAFAQTELQRTVQMMSGRKLEVTVKVGMGGDKALAMQVINLTR